MGGENILSISKIYRIYYIIRTKILLNRYLFQLILWRVGEGTSFRFKVGPGGQFIHMRAMHIKTDCPHRATEMSVQRLISMKLKTVLWHQLQLSSIVWTICCSHPHPLFHLYQSTTTESNSTTNKMVNKSKQQQQQQQQRAPTEKQKLRAEPRKELGYGLVIPSASGRTRLLLL